MNNLFGTSQTPAVILADRLDQVLPIKASILEKKEAEKAVDNPTIDRVRTIYDLMPQDQEEKIEVLWDIKNMLDTNPPDSLGISPEQVAKVNDFRRNLSLEEVSLDD